MSSSVIRAGDTWGTGGHAPPRPAPPPPPPPPHTHTHTHTHTFFRYKKKNGNKGKSRKDFKAKTNRRLSPRMLESLAGCLTELCASDFY